jgi:hypothetical protein
MDPLKGQTATATPAEPGGLFGFARLENWHRRKSIVGSNPTLPAIIALLAASIVADDFCYVSNP